MENTKRKAPEFLCPIYTTGAFLYPVEWVDESGETYWVWVVDEFIDDSFKEGNIFNPPELAPTLKELMVNTTDDFGLEKDS